MKQNRIRELGYNDRRGERLMHEHSGDSYLAHLAELERDTRQSDFVRGFRAG